MALPSPATLPISNPQNIPAGESQPPSATPAFRAFINHITEFVRSECFSDHRPWSQYADRSAFSKPESLSDAAFRIRKNYSYFLFDYLNVLSCFMGLFVTSPFTLIIYIGLLFAWLFLYLLRTSEEPLVIFHRTFSDGETLGVLTVFSIVVIFLSSDRYVVISVLLVKLVIVCAHGAFRNTEDLVLDQYQAASTSPVGAEAVNGSL